MQASTWSPSRAASAFFAGRVDAVDQVRGALLPVCGPGGTEAVLHTALLNNRPPQALLPELCGDRETHPREEFALRTLMSLVHWGLPVSFAAACAVRLQQGEPPLSLVMAFAYVIALAAGLRVAQALSLPLRLAWLLFSLSTLISIGRHIFEARELVPFWLGQLENPALGYRQFAIVGALLALFGGLAVLWRFYRRAGLGWNWTAGDAALMMVLLVAVPVTFEFRHTLGDAQSPYGLIRVLQSLSPFLLALVAVPAVALHRISRQLAGGLLSTVLQLLVCSIYLRVILLFVTRFVDPQAPLWVRAPLDALSMVPAWLFAWAALLQWKLLLPKQDA